MNSIQLVGTGPGFLKQGVRGIESVIEEVLAGARTEVHMLAYVFTPQAIHVIDLLESDLRKGVEVVLVVNELGSQNPAIRTRLISLRDRFSLFKLVDLANLERGQLHAKAIVADRKRAVIGSANFTWSGLVSNYEIGVFVEGDIAWQLASMIDALARAPSSRSA